MLGRLFSRSEQGPSYSIMVVEDDVPIANVIKELLEDEGFTVSVANTAEAGLKLLADEDSLPDAFIIDYMLPDMNGKQFIETVRVRYGTSKVPPVLMLTASKEGESVANALQVTDFLPKPFNNAELLDHVSKLIKQSK